MTATNGFARRFAIRLPSGELYTGHDRVSYEQACQAYAEWLEMPGPVRDMMQMQAYNMFGGSATVEAPKLPEPKVFDRREDAEELLKQLRGKAAEVGVFGWGGCVVEQLCTPFTSGDPSQEFAEQVTAWLQEQGGAS